MLEKPLPVGQTLQSLLHASNPGLLWQLIFHRQNKPAASPTISPSRLFAFCFIYYDGNVPRSHLNRARENFMKVLHALPSSR